MEHQARTLRTEGPRGAGGEDEREGGGAGQARNLVKIVEVAMFVQEFQGQGAIHHARIQMPVSQALRQDPRNSGFSAAGWSIDGYDHAGICKIAILDDPGGEYNSIILAIVLDVTTGWEYRSEILVSLGGGRI